MWLLSAAALLGLLTLDSAPERRKQAVAAAARQSTGGENPQQQRDWTGEKESQLHYEDQVQGPKGPLDSEATVAPALGFLQRTKIGTVTTQLWRYPTNTY